MDISSTLVSNSTQLDNIDLQGGARDFTITGVTLNDGDQPLSITLAEYGRPWKPGLTMRRLLSEMWGAESDAWIGRRVRLYRDASVKFGKDKTGGTRISHASHIDKKVTVTLPTSKGKFGEFTVQPLPDSAPDQREPTVKEIAACTDTGALKAMWKASGKERRALIEARVAEIASTNTPAIEAPVDTATGEIVDAGDNSQWDEAPE